MLAYVTGTKTEVRLKDENVPTVANHAAESECDADAVAPAGVEEGGVLQIGLYAWRVEQTFFGHEHKPEIGAFLKPVGKVERGHQRVGEPATSE
jgi:hypothetical protein